ncbi:MAG: HipA domain-containing protein [Bacilli bacterium]|nr:HipA domain-containing protein [Bacilli bacterium]
MIDFTNSKRISSKAFNGANGKKIAILYNEEQYMLKFPPSRKDKPTELSYTNSSISEYISCHIFNMLGIKAQETILGKYVVSDKEKIVCACKDFTVPNKTLYDFCSIKNTIIDSEHNGAGTELAEILEAIEKQDFVEPQKLLDFFWEVFIVDALVGNFDRHNGNWGFLVDNVTKKSEIAPIFDCGSCLLPQADENIIKAVINDERELDARIYRFPTSAINLNKKKINFYDYLVAGENKDCNKALKKVYESINIKEITDFIDGIEALSKLQKNFYKLYISARYEKILKVAYNKVI